jgi:hypothetical protein
MGKIKTTRKQLSENFQCIGFGYCSIQNLLQYKNPRFYTCGTYGWNFDGYIVEHNGQEICITTGYRGMIYNAKQNKDTYSIVKKYDNLAEKIVRNYQLPYDIQKKQVEELLHNMIDEILK